MQVYIDMNKNDNERHNIVIISLILYFSELLFQPVVPLQVRMRISLFFYSETEGLQIFLYNLTLASNTGGFIRG